MFELDYGFQVDKFYFLPSLSFNFRYDRLSFKWMFFYFSIIKKKVKY